MGRDSLRDADLKCLGNIEIYFVYLNYNTGLPKKTVTMISKFRLAADVERQFRKVLNFGINL